MERLRHTLMLGFLGVAAAAAWGVGCGEEAAPIATLEAEPEAPADPEPLEEPEEPPDPGPPKRIFAKRFVANVRVSPDPEADRIGYLRAGAVVMGVGSRPVAVTGEGRHRCEWYELDTGGFVCGGRDVIAFDGERLPEVRAAQPDREAKLPYRYGYARRDDTPVYRDLPSDEDAAQHEGYRIPGQPVVAEPADQAAVPAGIGGAEPSPVERDVPQRDVEPERAGDGAPTAADASGDDGPAPGREPAEEAEEAEEEGPPTLESLEGERHSILARRMMKGFYVSLDRDFRVRGRRYWRTQQHEFIPYHWLGLKSGSDYAGVVLSDAAEDPDASNVLPMGWVMSRKSFAYTRTSDGRVRRGRPPGFHHQIRITGEHEFRADRYWVTDDDRLFREQDITRIDARPRPDDVAADEKWIDVDLGTQTLVAYEGDRPVFATLVSTGIIIQEDVPALNHATPPGRYRIRAKHLATTMDGDNAFDGPYSIQDVPYVMYYEQGYALHSAFWHDLFGYTKSHGCVNLSPLDAKWIFDWADPQLPDGWHGVYPTDDEPGTQIVIRGETPRRRR